MSAKKQKRCWQKINIYMIKEIEIITLIVSSIPTLVSLLSAPTCLIYYKNRKDITLRLPI